MKYIQKTLALLLALSMLFIMVPAGMTASAEEVAPELTPVETVAPEETPAEETITEDVPTEDVPTEETTAEEPTMESPVGDIVVDKVPEEGAELDKVTPENPDSGAGIPTVPSWVGPVTWVDPLYANAADFGALRQERADYDTSSISYDPADYLSINDAALVLREAMQDRENPAFIYVRADSSSYTDVYDALYLAAMAHTGVPDEGDYLRWNTVGYEYYTYTPSLDYASNYYVFEIYPYYLTTVEQEAAVDSAVASLLSQLNLWSKTDYEKVRGVYDYLCANITYDYEHLGSETYFLHHSTYSAIIQHHTVCQGYATLFYRLLLEMGVDTRVITSIDHAWNIVELDGMYYNLDSTWDAGQSYYSWFLKSPMNFPDHPREAEYETVAFHAAYPMSPADYGETFDPVINTLTLNTWYTATIGSSGGSAYYQFTPSVSGYYTLSSSSGYDTRCDLYNSSWGLLNYDDDSGENYNFQLESWLDAGITYYYKVYFYGTSTGSFQIYLEKTDGGNSGGGGGEEETSFIPLTLNQAVDVNISTKDGRAFYSFTPSESGYYTLCSYSDSDTYCFIFNSAMERVSVADDSGPGANFFKTEYISAGDTYYFEVCFYSAEETGYFQICMTPAGATASGKIDNIVGNYYTMSDLTLGSDGVYRTPEGGTVYIAVDNDEEGGLYYLNNYTLKDFVDDYDTYYFDLTYWDTLCSLMDSDGYVELTQNSLSYLTRLITGNSNWQEDESYLPNYLFYDVSGGEEVTILPLSVNTTTAVNIMEAGQLAYYSFVPDQSGNYTLTASSSGSDTYCTLYDANWNLIATDDDSGDGLDFQLEHWLEAGSTYYFEVRYLSSSLTGSFQILLTRSVTVLPLSLNVSTTVTITEDERLAYYSFTPSESANYTLTAYSSGNDTFCTLYDENWNWVTDDDDSSESNDFLLEAWLEAGKTYYFEVRYYGSTTGSFSILLTAEEEEEITAHPLTLNEYTTVTISTGGESVYYFFTPSQSGYYTLESYSSSDDTYCTLLDADMNYLTSDDESGEGSNFLLECYLEAGQTYYYSVQYFWTSTTGSFDILLTAELGEGSGRIENNGNGNYVVADLILGNDGIYRTPDGCIVYIAIANYADGGLVWLTNYLLSGNTLYDYVDTYGTTYFDLTYWDELLALMDEYGYVVLTPTTLQYLITTTTGNPNWEETAEDVKYYLFYDPMPTEDIHTHNYSTVVTAPTCTEGGYTTYTCACGDSYVSDYTAALGHDYNAVVTQPTCTAGGYTTHTCTRCGDSYVGNYTAALGHDYSYAMTTEPTLSSTGTLTGSCSRCVSTTIVTMPKLNTVDYTCEITLEPTEETEGSAIYTWNVTEYGIFSVVVAVPKLSDILPGDLNGDGEVDIFDANLVVAYYNGTAELTDAQIAAADVNNDGDVDIFDANLIVSYYNGTIVSFPKN